MDPSEPLVLLPGLNCSAALWAELDLGPVETPVLTEPTLDGQVDRLLAELPDRFALAGLSLGGIVAMALVRRAPQRVSRLCLLSTTARPPTARQYAMWTRQRQALATGSSARDLQRELKGALLSPRARATRPDLIETTLAMADEVGTARLDAHLALQATRIDERPGLAAVRCPTLIVAGDADALCSPERHAEIHRHIPGSELVLLADCGHLSPLEQPAAVESALRRWSGTDGEQGREVFHDGMSQVVHDQARALGEGSGGLVGSVDDVHPQRAEVGDLVVHRPDRLGGLEIRRSRGGA